MELQKRYQRDGQSIRNLIQTNGTLINDEWAEFFKANDFKVGLSLDGDEVTHDTFRKGRDGGKTHGRVLGGIRVLRRHGIPFGVIQVLTSASAARLPENFRYFVDELGLRQWSMNVFQAHGNPSMEAQAVTNRQYADALKTLADLWIAQRDRGLRLREMESFVQGVMGRRTEYCTYAGSCTNYFCLNWDGRVFPCDSFTNHPESAFGSLHEDPLTDILNGGKRQAYAAKVVAVHPDCAECRWHPVCNNGCTSLRVDGPDGKYYYCDARREMFSYIDGIVEHVLGGSSGQQEQEDSP